MKKNETIICIFNAISKDVEKKAKLKPFCVMSLLEQKKLHQKSERTTLKRSCVNMVEVKSCNA